MKKMLEGLSVGLLPLDEKFRRFEISEVGETPLENAHIKSTEYYRIIKKPLFSCDSGLYIEGLQEDEQAGLNVRRINGKELSDQEMLEYYSGLVDELGGKVLAKYKNAIYLIVDDQHHYYHDGDDISEYFFLVSKPHNKTISGFP
ncbi:MAG: non-canonical purine NTP pyrophosphatase, partial [Thermotogota bacterium]|nr:non-canonical purine NTP pyrophosphatase [Thermotogota bacterium]